MYMERYGLRVFCLRIGAVRASDDPTIPATSPLIDLDADGKRNRLRAVWLSRRDCAELIAACLEADVDWAVVYGISANERRFWDLTHARELLGWEPQDAAPGLARLSSERRETADRASAAPRRARSRPRRSAPSCGRPGSRTRAPTPSRSR